MQFTDAQEMINWYAGKYSNTRVSEFSTPHNLNVALSSRILGWQECGNRRNMILVALFRRLDSAHRLALVERWWSENKTDEIKVEYKP